MKAVVEAVGASSGAGVQTGRVARRRDVENEEIQMYLSKLKDLVPFMPKNKRLTKLEVIQYVIDYICDLQYALEMHPSAEVAARLQGEPGPAGIAGIAGSARQPLGLLTSSPNTIVQGVCSTSLPPSPTLAEPSAVPSMSPVPLEKVQEVDTRPISC